MNTRRILFFITIIWMLTACVTEQRAEWEEGTWVDLTHEYSDETLYWPTSNPFQLDTVFVGTTDAGFYYESYEFRSAEHGGTHLDAPIHFFENRQTVEELSIDQLTGRAAVINVKEKVAENRDYQIQTEDITAWEQENGELQEGSIVLFNTGFAAYWPDAVSYLGTDIKGDEGVAELSFPGIHPDTANWLVENRSVKAVGLDTPSLDYGKSVQFETHQILFEQNIPGFENVANLDLLPPKSAFVIALPMKIKDGSGAPLRLVAHVTE
jgi:kynurenine formamidase